MGVPFSLNSRTAVLPAEGYVEHSQVYGDEWHTIGIFLRSNSAPGAADGAFRVWMDDQPLMDTEYFPWIGAGGEQDAHWNVVAVGGNDFYRFNLDENAPISERERWYAIDDIVVLSRLPARLQ